MPVDCPGIGGVGFAKGWLRGCAMGWAAVARPAGGVQANAKLEEWPTGGAATADSPAPIAFLPLP